MFNNNKSTFLILALLIVTTPSSINMQVLNLIKDLVQFNIAGHPVLHKAVKWPFDPEIGSRRARQYQELNGQLGEKEIQRLGLGIDGFDRERLAEQRARDKGHLNGLHYLTP